MLRSTVPPRQNPSILQGILMPQSLGSSAHFMPRHRFEPTADPCLGDGSVMNRAVLTKLERRLGRHCTQNCNFLHIENWCSVHSVIRTTLKLMGLYWRDRKKAEQIQVRTITSASRHWQAASMASLYCTSVTYTWTLRDA